MISKSQVMKATQQTGDKTGDMFRGRLIYFDKKGNRV